MSEQNNRSAAEREFWFALRVRTNYERVVSELLRNKDKVEFCPTYKTRKLIAGKTREAEQPLFPGYVFCRLDPNNRLPVLVTPGVKEIVGTAGRPERIAEEEINAIRTMIASGSLSGPCPYLAVGNRVEITHGPLMGLEGILCEVKSGYRLVLSITLLQRSISAEVDLACVRPVTVAPMRARIAG